MLYLYTGMIKLMMSALHRANASQKYIIMASQLSVSIYEGDEHMFLGTLSLGDKPTISEEFQTYYGSLPPFAASTDDWFGPNIFPKMLAVYGHQKLSKSRTKQYYVILLKQ